MPTPATLPDDLLTPIRPEQPAGDDLRSTGDWASIRAAKPNPYDSGDQGIWTKQSSGDTGWPQLLEKTAIAIKEKSKDLQLAIWLAEANTRVHGFAGLRDSLTLIRELLEQYWDSGLFPAVDDGDTETRLGPLQWLNEKLADLIREIPLTSRKDEGVDYSFVYFLESRRSGGSITSEQFDEASRLTDLPQLEAIVEDCAQAKDEFARVVAAIAAKFGPQLLSFSHTKEAFVDCQGYLHNALAQRRPNGQARNDNQNDNNGKGNPSNGKGTNSGFGLEETSLDESWANAELLVRTGKISEALSEMTRLAATAPNGRVRFHRKLLLADICLSTNRDRLATSILEELAELVEKHHLEEWEAPQVTGAVWSRLYRCYKNEKAGTADADKAAQLFLKLCRLDPWQALACSDGK